MDSQNPDVLCVIPHSESTYSPTNSVKIKPFPCYFCTCQKPPSSTVEPWMSTVAWRSIYPTLQSVHHTQDELITTYEPCRSPPKRRVPQFPSSASNKVRFTYYALILMFARRYMRPIHITPQASQEESPIQFRHNLVTVCNIESSYVEPGTGWINVIKAKFIGYDDFMSIYYYKFICMYWRKLWT